VKHIQRQLVFAVLLALSCLAHAQRLPRLGNMTPAAALAPAALQPVVIKPAVRDCARQAEPFDLDDYSGPLHTLVARVTQSTSRTMLPVAPRPAGTQPCAMASGARFHLWVRHTTDPHTFTSAAWDAALSQISHEDARFGQGAAGYSRRYSAAVGGSVTGDFFRTFLYPSLFHQDPRYYRVGEGTVRERAAHALAHRFVVRNNSGRLTLNYSEWLGKASSRAMNNLYHPGAPRGFAPAARSVGMSVAHDAAWDVLREFWPEIAHKLRLPFRID
jgi:hypothetical protein